jgi:DNA-binding IclR family transcriptional regulator
MIADGHRPVPRGTALISKAFVVLRQIARRHHTGWTLSELSTACGLSHPTVHRILSGLAAQGMVALRPGTKCYVLGPATLELAASAHPMFDLRNAGTEALKRLVSVCGGNAFLNVRSGYDLVCIGRVEGPQRPHALPLEVGARRPLCSSAGGVAVLLHLPRVEQAAALRYGLDQLESVGRQRRAAIRQMIRRSRELGFGLNRDQIVPGMTGIGVPILNARSEAVAAFTVTLLSAHLTENGVQRVVAEMRREAGLLASSAPPATD